MDGKLFLYNNATPPPMSQVAATTFAFDLQRFATYGLTSSSTEYFSNDEAFGYASSTDGKYFSVSNGKTDDDAHTRYFNNIDAAINYIYTADTTQKTSTTDKDDKTITAVSVTTTNNPYYDTTNSKYVATINVLQDVTEGQPFALGGLLSGDGAGIKVGSSDAKKTELTINLNNHSYNFVGGFGTEFTGNSKVRCIVTRYSEGSKDSEFTITNGKFTTANQVSSNVYFEGVIKSYVNLTLDSVEIDATNLKGQLGGEEGAAITHTLGDLNITGSTSISVQPDSGLNRYYAIGGELADEKGSYGAGFTINVETTGDIPRIGLYGWDRSNLASSADTYYEGYPTAFPADKMKLNIKSGNIGEITMDGVALDKKGYTSYSEAYNENSSGTTSGAGTTTSYSNVDFAYEKSKRATSDPISLTASTSNISVGSSLASFSLFDYTYKGEDDTSNSKFLLYQKNGEKYPYTYAIEGWNRQTAGDDT